jgi:hypothetical protein
MSRPFINIVLHLHFYQKRHVIHYTSENAKCFLCLLLTARFLLGFLAVTETGHVRDQVYNPPPPPPSIKIKNRKRSIGFVGWQSNQLIGDGSGVFFFPLHT